MQGYSYEREPSLRPRGGGQGLLGGAGRRGGTRGLVLGSGLGAFGDQIDDAQAIPYGEIPGFPTSAVAGHKGRFVLGQVDGVSTLVLQGRVHAYEGWSPEEVVFGVRTLGLLDIGAVVLTNAAGGLNPDFAAGDLMVISDHLNLAGWTPLAGPNDDRLGPRFPDMTDAYDPAMSGALRASADRLGGPPLRRGVYAGLMGPSYETPAEINMLRTLGADAVGMSTVPECIALRHMGGRVSGISCITNLAAGISPEPLSHEEVKETGARVAERFVALLKDAIPRLAEEVA